MSMWIVGLIVFLLVDLILVGWILLRRKRVRKFDAKELSYIRAQWIKIIDAFGAHPKHAILDADKLLDYALMKKGFEGNLGDKLKVAGARFSDLDAVWFAHRLRNKIAHELTGINGEDAKRALTNYKKALNDLGAKL
ncbi:hypothetical protein HYW82_04225 [Candidatus Peregrinibacteria bacterium]|nr:hypothetical protein [Candidatus Peregrinibacteria bacterium]